MTIKTHWLIGLAPLSRHHAPVSMRCGLGGWNEGGGEFTTGDGREARLFYTADPGEVTCLRCRRANLPVDERQTQG